jgi:O-methyltransferase
MKLLALRLFREMEYRTPLWLREKLRFRSNISLSGLCMLCGCISQTRDVPGAILEAGVDTGNTTVLLNKYMNEQGIAKDYFALDTFSGFTEGDKQYETTHRNKPKHFYDGGFVVNDRRWFDAKMKVNGLTRVTSIAADASTFDFGTIGPLSFAFVDLDLYLPMKATLAAVWQQLSPGGIVVAHDCDPTVALFDGSDQAYKEICQELGLPVHVENGCFGVLRRST